MRKTYVALSLGGVVTAMTVAATAVGDTNQLEMNGQGPNAADVTRPHESASVQGMRKPLPPVAAVQVQEVPGAVLSASVAALEAPAGTVYLTPAPGGPCLSLVRPGLGAGLTCGSGPATLLEGCTGRDTATCTRAIVYGVVPPGVDRVKVTGRDGATLASSDTTNGAYLLDLPLSDDQTAVEFQHPGGHVREVLPFVDRGD